uniref:Uncharacterized protein n=1 Tax=Caenorhabditis japonica TaxID=281687 RepID=A0A8R1I9H3_CAEJA
MELEENKFDKVLTGKNECKKSWRAKRKGEKEEEEEDVVVVAVEDVTERKEERKKKKKNSAHFEEKAVNKRILNFGQCGGGKVEKRATERFVVCVSHGAAPHRPWSAKKPKEE